MYISLVKRNGVHGSHVNAMFMFLFVKTNGISTSPASIQGNKGFNEWDKYHVHLFEKKDGVHGSHINAMYLFFCCKKEWRSKLKI